jgi:osmoprotectant transport system permease protein
MLIGNEGALGNLLNSGLIYNQPRLIWLSVVGTAVLALLVDAALIGLRVLLTPWMPRATRKNPRPLAVKEAAR